MRSFFLLFIISFNACAFNITPAITGSWYDKNNSGQGFNIEVLDNNGIIVYWYAYDQGNPIWLVGSGTYKNDTAKVSLSYFQGSEFGINHSENSVSRQPFGDVEFVFNNCDSANMTYNSSMGLGRGSIKLERLTNIAGLQCNDGVDSSPGQTAKISSIKGYGIDYTDNSSVCFYSDYPDLEMSDDPNRCETNPVASNATWKGNARIENDKLILEVDNLHAPFPPLHRLGIGYTVTLSGATFEDGSNSKAILLYEFNENPSKSSIRKEIPIKHLQ